MLGEDEDLKIHNRSSFQIAETLSKQRPYTKEVTSKWLMLGKDKDRTQKKFLPNR